MPLDFFGTALLGTITTQSGSVIDLFPPNGGGTVFTQENAGGVAPFLERVTVETDMGSNNIVSITLAPPFLDALNIMNSDLIEKDSVIAIRFGYTKHGLLTPWIKVVQLQPMVEFSTETSMTLQGHGFGFILGRAESDAVWGPSTTNTNTILDIINAIATKYSLKTTDASGNSTIIPDPGGSMLIKQAAIPQGHRSDWVFIRELAQSCGCEFWMDGVYCYVKPLASITGAAPQKTIVYLPGAQLSAYPNLGVASQLGDGVYPAFRVSFPTTAMWLPGVSRGHSGSDTDPDTGQDKPVVATQDTSTVPIGGKGVPNIPITANRLTVGNPQSTPTPLSDLVPGVKEAGKISHANARDPNVMSSRQHSVDDGALQNIICEATIPGVPFIQTGEMIAVRTGVRRFDGNFMIRKVVHEIGDGFTTTLTLQKSGYADVAQFVNTTGPVSDQPATNLADNTSIVNPTTPSSSGLA